MLPTYKTCERCLKSKPATEKYFDLNFRYRDGLKPYCRDCGHTVAAERRQRKNERSKAWYHANKEKARQVARESWQRNRSDRLAYLRRWREENKEQIAEYQRAYAERKKQEAQQQPLP